jgi:hypothetical protein
MGCEQTHTDINKFLSSNEASYFLCRPWDVFDYFRFLFSIF